MMKRPFKGTRTGGSASPAAAENDPHQNRVGLLQGPPEDGDKPLPSLFWFWPRSGGLPGIKSKQELLEMP